MSVANIKPKDWLPHCGPMLMISHVLTFTEQAIQCTAKIRPDNPLLNETVFPAIAGIELFAQAAGILFGLRNVARESAPKTKAGAVIQLKSFEISQVVVPVGKTVEVSAQYIGGNSQAVMMRGQVDFAGRNLFTGTLMIALFSEERT